MTHRRDIQCLRAVAVLLVILAHARLPFGAGGFIGVDVFFVISGYLITGLLLGELATTGRLDYPRFVARRLRRLLPAMLVVLGTTFAAALAMLTPREVLDTSGSLPWALTWTSNIYFTFSDFDYFGGVAVDDLYLHTWSLGVEEQFYLVWPLLLVLAMLAVRSGGAERGPRLGLVFVAIVVAGFAFCLAVAERSPLASFYLMPSRAWQFAAGALVFVLRDFGHGAFGDLRRRLAVTAVSAGCTLIGLALILASALLISPHMRYPGLSSIWPTLGAMLVLFGGSDAGRADAAKTLGGLVLAWIGDRSYSLYLWHWPVFSLVAAFGLMDRWPFVLSSIALSMGLAALTYRWVELPFWKGRYSRAGRGRTLAATLSVLAAAFLAASGARHLTAVNDAMSASAGNPRFDRPYLGPDSAACDTWYRSAAVRPCVIAGADADRTVVLIGDSIGAQWASLLPELYPPREWRSVVLTKSGCPIVDRDIYYSAVGDTYTVCREWREAAVDRIVELRPGLVLIGSSAQYDFDRTDWEAGTRSLLEQLDSAGIPAVLIPGTPTLTFDGPTCLQHPSRFSLGLTDSRRQCEERLESTLSKQVAAYLRRVADEFDSVAVLDLSDLVCPDDRCAAVSESGVIVYRDDEHLTNTFVLSIVPQVRERVARIGLSADGIAVVRSVPPHDAGHDTTGAAKDAGSYPDTMPQVTRPE